MKGGDWQSQPATSQWSGAPPDLPSGAPGLTLEGDRYGPPRRLGAGGMGVVEAVYDRVLDREVARKTLRPGLDPRLADRLVREARWTARLDHPGIVPVYDAGIDELGRPWYTMRLVVGRALDEVLAGIEPGRRLALVPRILAAAQALAYAHSRGMVHRDLKPENLMVGPYGETLIVDWGLARSLDHGETLEGESPEDPSGTLTKAGVVLGTPRWMSPEQARGEPCDARSDVYSLGRVLHHVVTGSPEGDLTGAPPDLASVIRRATAASPGDRYPDGAGLAADLEAFVSGGWVGAHDYGLGEALSRWARPRKALLATVGAAGLAVIGLGGLSWLRTVAERDRAVTAEEGLATVLAQARADQAVAALRRDDTAGAAQFAAESLSLRDSPRARGVAAALLGAPWPVRTAAFERPDCAAGALQPSGARLACLRGDRLEVVWALDGSPNWDTPQPPGRYDHLGWGLDDRVIRADRSGLEVLDSLRPVVAEAQGALPSRELVDDVPGLDALIVNQQDFVAVSKGAITWIGCPTLDQLGQIVEAPRSHHRQVAGTSAAVAAVGDGSGWWGLCSDGLALHGEGAGPFEVVALGDPSRPLVRSSSVALAQGALLVGTLDGEVFRVEPGVRSERVVALEDGGIRQLLPAGERLVAVRTDRGSVFIVDLVASVVVARLPGSSARGLGFDPDWGLRVHTAQGVETWDLPPEAPGFRGPDGISDLDVSVDGDLVATADGGGRLTLRRRGGALEGSWRWDPQVLKALSFEPEGKGLWAGSSGIGSVRRLDLALRQLEDPGYPHHGRALQAMDVGVLVASWHDGVDVVGDGPPRAFTPGVTRAFSASAARHRVAVVADGLPVRVLAWPGGEELLSVDAPDGIAALSPDGQVLALWSRGEISLHDVDTGGRWRRWPWPAAPTALAASEAARELWIGGVDGRLHVVDGESGRPKAELPLHDDRISDIVLRDGLAWTASWDRTVRRLSVGAVTGEVGGVVGQLEALGAGKSFELSAVSD